MKSVVICGSSRFASEIREFAAKLKELGVVVYAPYLGNDSGGFWEETKLQTEIPEFYRRFIAMGLTHDHFYKMRLADVVYVFNKDAYAGVSVNMEIGYAVALNKPIYARDLKDAEEYRQVLFSGAAATPEELLKFLQ